MKRAALFVLLAGCAGGPPTLEELGRRLLGESDPGARLVTVRDMMETGDPAMVPLFIDALKVVAERGKLPDPDYTTVSMTPETRGPELWALITVTRQDFKRDATAWRTWWDANGATLRWDGGQKAFLK